MRYALCTHMVNILWAYCPAVYILGIRADLRQFNVIRRWPRTKLCSDQISDFFLCKGILFVAGI